MLRALLLAIFAALLTPAQLAAQSCSLDKHLSSDEILRAFSGKKLSIRPIDGDVIEMEFRRDGTAVMKLEPPFEFTWFTNQHRLCSKTVHPTTGATTQCGVVRAVYGCDKPLYALYDTNGKLASTVLSVTQLADVNRTQPNHSTAPSGREIGEGLGALWNLYRNLNQGSSGGRAGGSQGASRGCAQDVSARATYCKVYSESGSNATQYYLECDSRSRKARRTCRGAVRYESTVPFRRDPYYCDPQTNERNGSLDALISKVCQ